MLQSFQIHFRLVRKYNIVCWYKSISNKEWYFIFVIILKHVQHSVIIITVIIIITLKIIFIMNVFIIIITKRITKMNVLFVCTWNNNTWILLQSLHIMKCWISNRKDVWRTFIDLFSSVFFNKVIIVDVYKPVGIHWYNNFSNICVNL